MGGLIGEVSKDKNGLMPYNTFASVIGISIGVSFGDVGMFKLSGLSVLGSIDLRIAEANGKFEEYTITNLYSKVLITRNKSVGGSLSPAFKIIGNDYTTVYFTTQTGGTNNICASNGFNCYNLNLEIVNSIPGTATDVEVTTV